MSSKFISLLTNRYCTDWSDADLRKRLEIFSSPVQLSTFGPDESALMLSAAAARIFLLDDQRIAIIRRLVSLARAHAVLNFKSDEDFRRGLMSTGCPWKLEPPPALCLSGHSGVGKTELLEALARLLSDSPQCSMEGVRNIRLTSLWQIEMSKGSTLTSALRPVLNQHHPMGVKDKAGIPNQASHLAWREAVCLILADEFQFLTASSSANASIVACLHGLRNLGPALVYCANFSLLWRIKSRPAEDIQRLLAALVVLMPDEAGSESWKAFLFEIRKIDSDALDCLTGEIVGLIHDYTWGIRRKAVCLVSLAYIQARQKRRYRIERLDIDAAYASLEYASHRQEVETLLDQATQNKLIRRDLWCPFDAVPLPGRPAQKAGVSGNVVNLPVSKEQFEQRVNDLLLKDSMTPTERAVADALAPKGPPTGKKVSIFRRKPLTPEELLDD